MTVETEYAPFDVSDYLDNDEMIAEYLTAAAEDDNPDVLLLALANVAKAHGMAKVAKAAGLGRESLYKALAPGSHPRFETIVAVLRALGVTVVVRGSKAADARTPKDFKLIALEADRSKTKTIAAKDLAKAAAMAKRRTLAARKHAAERVPGKRA